MLGGVLLSDKTNNMVNLMYLPLLANLQNVSSYSWGSACLAWLYRQLCDASRYGISDIAGPLILLQIWAWERFPILAPRRIAPRDDYPDMDLPPGPIGERWRSSMCCQDVSTHVLLQYRECLDVLRPEHIIWTPYDDIVDVSSYTHVFESRLWRARVPLICFHVIEFHCPDRVLRQFGLYQDIPQEVDTSVALHEITLSGHSRTDWSTFHASYIAHWIQWEEYVQTTPPFTSTLPHDSPYMMWYAQNTMRFITETGSLLNYLEDKFNAISLRHPDDNVLGEMCTDAKNFVHSHCRVRRPIQLDELDQSICEGLGDDEQHTLTQLTRRGSRRNRSEQQQRQLRVHRSEPEEPLDASQVRLTRTRRIRRHEPHTSQPFTPATMGQPSSVGFDDNIGSDMFQFVLEQTPTSQLFPPFQQSYTPGNRGASTSGTALDTFHFHTVPVSREHIASSSQSNWGLFQNTTQEMSSQQPDVNLQIGQPRTRRSQRNRRPPTCGTGGHLN